MYTSLAHQSSSSLQNALIKNGLSTASNASASTSTSSVSRNAQDDSIQSQMERSLARSITLVFWYATGKAPIRLLLELPTFPLFQLSVFPSVIADLSLSSSSYIDMYNEATGYWEQRSLNAVKSVDGGQRVLCRMRKSLLQGMEDAECIGLNEEVQRQPMVKLVESNGKRSADDTQEGPTRKYYISEGYQPHPQPQHHPQSQQSYPQPSYQTQCYPQSLSTPNPTATPSVPSNASVASTSASPSTTSPSTSKPGSAQYLYAPKIYSPQPPPTPLPSHISAPRGPAPPIPYHPHPPLKRWPNDYTVSEVAQGFRLMDSLSHPATNGTVQVTQRVAFERVFGSRYVKSTVCRHRGVWRRADDTIRREFEMMGGDERAMWGEFVRRVEGRAPGKAGSGEKGQLQQSGTLESGGSGSLEVGQHHGQQQPSVHNGRQAAEPAMGSLVPLPPGTNSNSYSPEWENARNEITDTDV